MGDSITTLPFSANASLLFDDVLTEFQNDKRDKSCAPGESAVRLRHLQAFLHLHNIKTLQDISHHVLRGYKLYLKGRDLTPVTVNDYMTMAKTFFAWCVRQELLESDPTSKWDRTPEPRREIEVLDRTEVAAMLGVVRMRR